MSGTKFHCDFPVKSPVKIPVKSTWWARNGLFPWLFLNLRCFLISGLFYVLIEEAEQSSHNSVNGPKRRRAKREYVGQDAASRDELETENPTARYVCKRVKVVRPPVLASRVPSRSIKRRLIPAAGTAGVI